MLFDLQLDTTSHDLSFNEIGEILTTEGAPLVAQKIEVRLKTQTGTWAYDLSMGIDYLGRVLVKAADPRVVRSLFVAEINRVPEVVAIDALTLSTAGRAFSLEFEARTTQGAISGGV